MDEAGGAGNLAVIVARRRRRLIDEMTGHFVNGYKQGKASGLHYRGPEAVP